MNIPKNLNSLNLSNPVLDHVGIAVTSLEEASLVYELAGLERLGEDELIASQQVKVRIFKAGETLFELLEPTSNESPIAKFIEKRGSGLHHLALRVADLDFEIKRLLAEKAQFIDPQPRAGRAGTRVVFLHPKWAKGVLLELLEHKA